MEDNKKKDEQQALVPAENLLIFEPDDSLEFAGTHSGASFVNPRYNRLQRIRRHS